MDHTCFCSPFLLIPSEGKVLRLFRLDIIVYINSKKHDGARQVTLHPTLIIQLRANETKFHNDTRLMQ